MDIIIILQSRSMAEFASVLILRSLAGAKVRRWFRAIRELYII